MKMNRYQSSGLIFILVVCLLLNSSPLKAQLSGTYVVNPAGSGDYSSISAAINDLSTQGVSGPVTINIAPGTYNEQCMLDSIGSTSATNTITIQSQTGNAGDVVWEFDAKKNANNYILKIHNISHVTIKDLTFSPLNNDNVLAIAINGGAEYLTIEDNVFEYNNSSPEGSAIYTSMLIDSVTLNSRSTHNLLIKGNYFNGFEYGFITNTAIYDSLYTINNNTFAKISYHCIHLIGMKNVSVNNNYKDSTYNADAGIYFNSITGNIKVTKNRIYNADVGFVIGYSAADYTSPGLVANNFFQGEDNGIMAIATEYIEYYHNSTYGFNGSGASFTGGQNNRAFNNIYYSVNGDAAAVINSSTEFSKSDYNAFYCEASDTVVYDPGAWKYYATLPDLMAAFQIDSHSIVNDPVYLGKYNLHASSQSLKGAGKPISFIIEDIDGEPRDPFAPDIGADEIQAVANLKPDSLNITPATLKAGHGLKITWFSKNDGDAKMTGPWEDAVYLSKNDQLDQGDLLLGTTQNNFDLFAGSPYQNSQSFILPEDSSGTYYFILKLDDQHVLPEDKADNTFSSQAYNIIIPDRPDLVVDSVWGPKTTFSGKKFELSWQVRNAGNEPTQVQWTDMIYFSSDSGYFAGNNFVIDSLIIGSDINPVGLQPGETYIGKKIVTPPLKINGNYFYKVMADAHDEVTEMNEGHQDNGAVSKPIKILQSPIADLILENITVPSTSFSGEKIIISFDVKNVGNAPTLEDYWIDKIYISQDSTLGLGGHGNISIDTWGDGVLLGKNYHSGELQPGNKYTVVDTLQLPKCISGKYYVYFFADGSRSVFESIDGNNLNRSDSVDVILKPQPDLEVTQMNVLTSNPANGQPLEVEFTVSNNGPASTSPGDNWVDYIYVSKIDTFNPEEAIVIGSKLYDQKVDSNSSYQHTRTCAIPDSVVGDFYLYIFVDKSNQVCEGVFENNNIYRTPNKVNFSLTPPPDLQVTQVLSGKQQFYAGEQIAVTYTVQNKGTGITPESEWTDNIYFVHKDSSLNNETLLRKNYRSGALQANDSFTTTVYVNTPYKITSGDYIFKIYTDKKDVVYEHNNENNNIGSSTIIQVTVDPDALSDLEVINLSYNSPGSSGDPLTVSYTVRNNNPAKTSASAWYDYIRLSDQNNKTILQKKIYHLGALDSMESYQVQRDIILPNGRSGNFTIEVETDSTDIVAEYEEANNVKSQSLQIILSPWPDLHVSYIHSDTFVLAGQKLSVAYIIDNSGSGNADDTLWHDKVYLSKDPILDDGDILLQKNKRQSPVLAGGNYQHSFQERVPVYISGDYLLIVETDSENEVFENTEENNNYAVSDQYITVLQPNPVDLVPIVDSFSYDSLNSIPKVTYTIQNQSTNPAIGSRDDQLYFSSDKEWDKEDLLIYQYPVSYDTIPAGAYQQLSHSAYLPYAKPGYYHLIHKTDAFNVIPETDLLNNTITYIDSIYIDNVPVLKPDSTHMGGFSGSMRSDYWQLQVPVNKAVLLEMWNADFQFMYNPVYPYLRHEDLPTIGEYDYKYQHPFQTEQEIIVPSKGARTDFILARGNTAGVFFPDSVDYKIRAEFKDFSIYEHMPDKGGQYGKVVMDIRGFDFIDSMHASLYNLNDTIVAEHIYFRSSNLVRAHFNLKGRDTGIYHLMLTKLDSNITTKSDSAFTILPQGFSKPWVNVVTPGFSRIGEGVIANVYYGNSGPVNDYDIQLVVAVYHESNDPENVEVTFMGDNMNHFYPKNNQPNPPGDSGIWLYDSIYFYRLWFPNLPAFSSGNLSFKVTTKTGGKTYVRAFYVKEAPSYFSASGDFEGLKTSNTIQLMDSLLAIALGKVGNNSGNKLNGGCNPYELNFDNMVTDVKGEVVGLAEYVGLSTPQGWAQDRIKSNAIDRVVTNKQLNDMVKGSDEIWSQAKDLEEVQKNPFFEKQINLIGDCLDFKNYDKGCYKVYEAMDPNTGVSTTYYVNTCHPDDGDDDDGGGGSDGGTIESINPDDPNEIVGPAGEGPLRFVRKDEKMNYTIYFENKPTATAPAQTVTINNPLHKNFRLQDFRLKQIAFGDTVINLGKVAYAQQNIPLGPKYGNLELNITAGANYGAKNAFWILKTIDPATGFTPQDPTAGFLPPNDSTDIGQGYVTYEVTLQDTTSSGTVIDNQATIIFDDEAPLSTNIWENVVAGNKPVSAVDALPQQVNTTTFKVTWEGTDGIPFGTGLKGYDVYVSENGKPYELWQQMTKSTAAIFTGEVDSTYRFFSIAEDMTGVRESAPNTADATVTIKIIGIEEGPEAAAELDWKVYPNPFDEQLRIDYEVASPGNVQIELFDLYGKLIRRPVDGFHNTGGYNLTIDAGEWDLAPGVYLLMLRKDEEVFSRKVIRVE